MGCGSSTLKYQKSNPAVEIACPEGALVVQPGLNSFSLAVKDAKENTMEIWYNKLSGIYSLGQAAAKAKEKSIDCLFLLPGVHDEKGQHVEIDFPLKVVGQNRDDVKIRGGLHITGKKEEDVFFRDCTVTGAKGCGVWGDKGASLHLKNVCVEKSGYSGSGVVLLGTTRNTMTDCNVNNNMGSGVSVQFGGIMTIDGRATTINRNCTGGANCDYGMDADTDSSILLNSVTKKLISTNNGGGGNYGGDGTIEDLRRKKAREKAARVNYRNSIQACARGSIHM